MDREKFVSKLKEDLDRWNDQIGAWEARLRDVQEDARARTQAHLEAWREQRDLAAHKLNEVRSASAAAWSEVARGADAAWGDFSRAVERARRMLETDARHRTPGSREGPGT